MKRSRHSLSHYRLATMDMGQLVPVSCLEVLPGDSFSHSSRVLLRVNPLVAPVMHPVQVRIHHWFVPNRLLWSDWDRFITGADDTLSIPTIGYTSGTDPYPLIDAMGVPDVDQTLNALPIRAYNKIWNDRYRDQDIDTAVSEDSLELQRIRWEKDRFTTARAEPQIGDAVTIPFAAGTQAPVRPEDDSGNQDDYSYGRYGTAGNSMQGFVGGASGESGNASLTSPTGTYTDSDYYQLFADLSQAVGGGIDIQDFRDSLSYQRFLEARNRYGSRHEDYLRYLGIRPSDARLQNPEYLGGGRQNVSFSEVLATAEGTSTNVGDLKGHGIGVMSSRKYRRFFEESGIVLSLMSIRPKLMYSQQLHRMWLRSSYQDYWQKEFEAMGPQEVLTKEVYGEHGNATDVFGWSGRHDEYRHHHSYVSGEFRPGGIADSWHMARDFSASPTLNSSFLECSPTDRIYASTEEPEIYAMVSHNISARRLVSKRARY